jgi:hypothetical protein
MSHPIKGINGVDVDVAKMLKSVGIKTAAKFLEASKSAKARKDLAAKTGIDVKLILKWANRVDRMRVRGVGEEYAELLQAAGVDTVRELKYRNPAKLAKAMAEANASRKLVRFLPSAKAVVRWIEHAKKLPLKISY